MYQEIVKRKDVSDRLDGTKSPAVFDYLAREEAAHELTETLQQIAIAEFGFKKCARKISNRLVMRKTIRRIKKVLTTDRDKWTEPDFKFEFQGLKGNDMFEVSCCEINGCITPRSQACMSSIYIQVSVYHVVDTPKQKSMVYCGSKVICSYGDNLLEHIDAIVSEVVDALKGASERYYRRELNSTKKRGKIILQKTE